MEMDRVQFRKCAMEFQWKIHLIRTAILAFFFYATQSETIKTVVLPYACSPHLEDGECRWSNWTRSCFWPQTDLDGSLKNLTDELGSNGCQPPRTDFARQAFKRRIELVVSNALLRRLTEVERPCGACSFRLRCCNKAPDFLHQSIDALQCTRASYSEACVVDALTPEELEANQIRHPDWPHTSDDMCDFNQFIPIHLAKGQGSTSRLMTHLMCSLYGMTQPIITCTKLSDLRCQCCCNGFVPTSDGICVPDPSPRRRDPECERDETESETCPWKDKRLDVISLLKSATNESQAARNESQTGYQ